MTAAGARKGRREVPPAAPDAWLRQALALFNAAAIHGGQIPEDIFPKHIYCDADGVPLPVGATIDMSEVEHNFEQISICTMLAGMAAENALKGMIAANGKKPEPTHEIAKMADEAGTVVPMARTLKMGEDDVRRVLATMEEAVRWAARYPVSMSGDGNKGVGSADHIEARRIALLLIARLAGHLGGELAPIPPRNVP